MQKRITEAHLLLVITFGIYIGFQWCRPWLPVQNDILHVVMGQLILVLPGACWLKHKGISWKERLRFHPLSNENIKMAAAVLVCAYPAAVLLNIFSMLFVKNAMTSVISSMVPLGLLPMLVIMALMPAFNEEFLCRGILYQAYAPVSRIGGAVLSAFIFGLLHLNLNQMLYAFYLGIVFALMVEATDSLYTSMLMHFILNAFNVVLNFLMYSHQPVELQESQAAMDEMIGGMTASPSATWKNLMLLFVALLFFMVMTGIMIWKTFQINGRSIRYRSAMKSNRSTEKTSIIDIWIIFFIGFALFLTVINTKFL